MLRIAKLLKDQRDEIIRLWEQEVLTENQSHGTLNQTLLLRKHLPELLNSLSEKLEKEAESGTRVDTAWVYEWHGLPLDTLNLPEVIREYSLFRLTLNNLLVSESTKDIGRVHQCLDEAIMSSVSQLADVREEQYRQLNKSLKRSNDDLKRFAAVVAHDVRSPLSTIFGYVGLLEEELGESKSAQTQQTLNVLSSTSQRLLTMVEKLLDYSTLAGEKLEPQSVSLNKIITDVLSDLKYLVDETHSKVFVHSLPTVKGDSVLLGQLFQNLIANSIKFRKANTGAIIRIGLLEETDECWTFYLKDEGIGFEPEMSEIIFEPFKRLHSKEEYKGSGLGLGTCRRVVELHGGKIWAKGSKNEGAIFKFTIYKFL